MRHSNESRSARRRRTWSIAALSSVVALTGLAAVPAAQAAKKPDNVKVKVMTRNIYLGADLGPALQANSFTAFTRANGRILEEVDQTNFPLRAQGLAAEIATHKPDLVGLQEVAWWRTNPNPGPPAQGPTGNFTATTTRYDFLALLLQQLETRGLNYTPAVVKTEFDFEAPTDTDNNSQTGLFGGDIQGRLTMRDVILVNEDAKNKIKVKNPQSGTYASLFTPNISGIDVPVTRGWTSVDAKVKKVKGQGDDKRKLKRKFHFVNTHLEAFDNRNEVPSIRAQQATELVNGPASPKRTILLGDLNSDVPGLRPGDEQAFSVVLGAGFQRREAIVPASCCVNNLFTSPPSQFDHQVDHIVTNMGGKAKLRNSTVTGLEQVNGIYNSDHAGIVSKLKLK